MVENPVVLFPAVVPLRSKGECSSAACEEEEAADMVGLGIVFHMRSRPALWKVSQCSIWRASGLVCVRYHSLTYSLATSGYFWWE